MVPLYVAGTAYGLGLGVWFASEVGTDDPGIALIPVTILGVAAPLAVFALDHPPLRRGVPSTTTAGITIGAGEALVIAGYQRASSDNPLGFRGTMRLAALASTVGAVGGYALGVIEEPAPQLGALAMTGAFWGGAIGGMFGYGASAADEDFARADDSLTLGTLIGFNAGVAAAASLGLLVVPSSHQLKWIWVGGAIGVLASSPVFLLYLGDSGPPAKRGFVFMGTASLLGTIAGGILSYDGGAAGAAKAPGFGSASVEHVVPTFLPGGGLGLELGGTLF